MTGYLLLIRLLKDGNFSFPITEKGRCSRAGKFEVDEDKAGPRSDVEGTPKGRAASDTMQADFCRARCLRRWDWFVEVYARAEGP